MKKTMSLTSVTRSELKALNISDFKEGDLIDVINKDGEAIYTIHVSYGNGKYSRASLCTTVTDKNYNLLGCTPGTPNGWPYYISDFIRSINEK